MTMKMNVVCAALLGTFAALGAARNGQPIREET